MQHDPVYAHMLMRPWSGKGLPPAHRHHLPRLDRPPGRLRKAAAAGLVRAARLLDRELPLPQPRRA